MANTSDGVSRDKPADAGSPEKWRLLGCLQEAQPVDRKGREIYLVELPPTSVRYRACNEKPRIWIGFVKAQDRVFETALAELHAGAKRSHWMWFIFPQLRGLGSSSTSQYYGLASLAEAQDYLKHSLLGPRLELCTRAVLAHPERSLLQIFGRPDDLKFLSSVTLFAAVSPVDNSPFHDALNRWHGGHGDPRTLALLK